MLKKRGQVAIFIIVAVVIVAGLILFFAFGDRLFSDGISEEFRPIYNLYGECIEQEAQNAISVLGMQGGKIDTGNFVPGSEFAPFSNHLNFLGIGIPYWYYISSNGVIRQDVPTRSEMELELENYLKDNINNCDFDRYYAQGFYIELPDEVDVSARILDEKISFVVDSNVVVSREDRSARKTKYEIEIESKTGKFYDLAVDIYEKQSQEAFLEEYAVDVIRLYAPVDGVEIQCSPKIWNSREVAEDIRLGLEANTAALKLKGDYYNLNQREDEYFVIDHSTDESVRFMYSKDWPSKIEVTPTEGSLMISQPIGNQQGLGVLGFCYTPYHFVYDVSFPVLIQISDGFEIFQFPIVAIVDNNLPREANLLRINDESDVDVCMFKENDIEIRTFDSSLNPVEAEVSYKCFNSVCELGESKISGRDAILSAKAPSCFNGEIVAKAEGFADESLRFSTTSESFADVILERSYEVEIELSLDGEGFRGGLAMISFVGEDSATAILPGNGKIKLKEGSYDVSVYAYGNSSIVIPGSSRTECIDVSRKGVLGFFGATKEECHIVNIPEMKVEQVLIGGGTTNTYMLESELQRGVINIDAGKLPFPRSLEQLQYNFESFNTLGVRIN